MNNTNINNYMPTSTGVLTNPQNYASWQQYTVPQTNFNFSNPAAYNTNQLGILSNPTGLGQQPQNSLGNAWGSMGFGDKINTVLGGLQTLGGLYGSIKSIGMAEKQMAQQRDQWNKTWGMAVKQHNEGAALRSANKYNQNRDAASKDYNRNKVEK